MQLQIQQAIYVLQITQPSVIKQQFKTLKSQITRLTARHARPSNQSYSNYIMWPDSVSKNLLYLKRFLFVTV